MADQIQRDFEVFHRAHPEVFRLFSRFANQMLTARFKHGSAALIFERIRWETGVVMMDTESVKLNNNYRALYARLWEKNNPDHKGFFLKRKRRAHTVNSVETGEYI